jgi:1-acyl-sn-glycerol-3-phosphate acyltransferase
MALLACAVAGVFVAIRWRRSGLPLDYFLVLNAVRLYARLWHGMRMNRQAPLPAKGGAIVVANHTCSSDPSFLLAGCPRPVAFLYAREYSDDVPWLRPAFEATGAVPVRRDGRDVKAVRLALRRLREGHVLGVFPEGGLSGAGRGRIHRCRCGVALLALRSQAPVFPAFIDGGPQTSSVSRAWLYPSRVRVTFGSALDLSAYYHRRINRPLLEEVTAYVMGRVAELDPRKRNEPQRHREHRDQTTQRKSESRNQKPEDKRGMG